MRFKSVIHPDVYEIREVLRQSQHEIFPDFEDAINAIRFYHAAYNGLLSAMDRLPDDEANNEICRIIMQYLLEYNED